MIYIKNSIICQYSKYAGSAYSLSLLPTRQPLSLKGLYTKFQVTLYLKGVAWPICLSGYWVWVITLKSVFRFVTAKYYILFSLKTSSCKVLCLDKSDISRLTFGLLYLNNIRLFIDKWINIDSLCTQNHPELYLSLIHIWRCRRIERCRSRWSPYH